MVRVFGISFHISNTSSHVLTVVDTKKSLRIESFLMTTQALSIYWKSEIHHSTII